MIERKKNIYLFKIYTKQLNLFYFKIVNSWLLLGITSNQSTELASIKAKATCWKVKSNETNRTETLQKKFSFTYN